MSFRNLFLNITTSLCRFSKKALLLGVLGLVCAEVWAGTVYTWTGSGGDTNWSTAGNWSPAGGPPSTSDDVVIDTSTSAFTIIMDSDVTIHGMICFGGNDFTLTSTNKKLTADVVYVGSSGNAYRQANGLPGVTVTESQKGNIHIAGSTTADIKYMDTSSWTTPAGEKNTVALQGTSLLAVTEKWNAGDNAQNGTTNRTAIERETDSKIIVSGTIIGADQTCKDDLKQNLDNGGAAVVETPTTPANTYYWLGTNNNNWHDKDNWYPSTAVPNGAAIEVVIPKATNTPEISSDITLKSISIAKDGGLTVNAKLNISETLTINDDTELNTASTGTIVSTGTVNIKSTYTSTTLSIECKDLSIADNLSLKNLKATDSIGVTSGTPLITLNGDLDVSNVSSWSSNLSLKFDGAGSQSFSNKSTCTYPSITISGGTVTASDAINVNTLSITSGEFTTGGDVTINTNLSNAGTVSGAGIFHIKDALTDTGTWSGTGKIIFDGTADQTFTPNSSTTYPEIEENKTSGKLIVDGDLKTSDFTITKGTDSTFNGTVSASTAITLTDSGTTTFANTVSTGTFGIANATDTTFNGAVTITTFNDDADSDASTNAGNISFNAGGTISSATTFATTGDVTFSETTALSFGANTVEHTAGTTVLKGKVTASKLTIANGSLEATSEIDGQLELKGGATSSDIKTLSKTSGTLKVSGNIKSTGYYSLGSNSSLTIQPITAGSTITFTNSGNLEIPHSTKITANFTNNGTLSSGGSGTGSACTITGDFTNTGSMTIPSGKYFSVTGNLDDSAGTSWNGTGTLQFTGTTDQTFTNKSGQTYPSVNVKLSADKTVTVSNPLTITKLNLTSGNITFSDSVTVTDYSETNTPTGNITFNGATSTFTNDATFATTGTVTVAASKKLSAATDKSFTFKNTTINGTVETTGTGAQTYNGTTTINGTISSAEQVSFGSTSATTLSGSITSSGNVTFDTSATLEVQSITAEISAADIKTPAISSNSTSNNITLKSSTGNFTTGQIGADGTHLIGASSMGFDTVTFDSGSTALTVNSRDIFANNLILKSTGAITVNTLNFAGELKLNTTSTSTVTLNGGAGATDQITLGKLTFSSNPSSNPSSISLSGKIEVTGNDGIIIPDNGATPPVGVPVTLTADTTLKTSGTSAPITLFDNLSGAFALTIDNSGTFTLKDDTSTSDPADSSTAPATALSVASFTQSGSGSNSLSGDISATGNISFAKQITLTGNFSCKTTGGTLTFADKIDGAHQLITSSSGDTTFTGAVGSTTALGEISVTAPNATVSGSLAAGSTSDITFALSSGTLTFNGASDTTVNGQKLKITNNGSIDIFKSSNTITFNCPVEVIKDVTVTSGTADFEKQTSVDGNFHNKSGSTTKTNNELRIKGNFTDEGTFTETTNSSIVLNGTGAQTFAPSSVTYQKIIINKTSGAMEFNTSTLNAKNLTVTEGHGTTFKKSVAITTVSDTTNAGNITFETGGSITDRTTFATTGKVTFGTDASHTFTFGSTTPYTQVTHTAGPTAITGTLTAASVTLGDSTDATTIATTAVTFKGKILSTGNQTFNSTVSGADMIFEGSDISINQKAVSTDNITVTNSGVFTLADATSLTDTDTPDLSCIKFIQNGTGTISISGDISVSNATPADGTATFTTQVTLTGDVKIITSGDVTFVNTINGNFKLNISSVKVTFEDNTTANEINITNSGLFDAKGSITYTTSFTQNGTAPSQFQSSFTGSGNASFTENVYLCGTNTSAVNFSAGTGNISISKNLIISTPAARQTTLDTISAKNIVLYSGEILQQSDFTTTEDLVLLGASYTTTDDAGTADSLKYMQNRFAGDTTGAKNNYDFESSLPDGTSITTYDGKLTGATGKNVTIGKNFYANGLAIKDATILIVNNVDSKVNFAEAIECNISTSSVYDHSNAAGPQIACENCTIDTTSKTNGWNGVDLEISEAYTVRANVVFVKFNKTVRNKNGELNKILSENLIKYSDNNFAGIFSDADCITPITAGTETDSIYIKANGSWNTDATGTWEGDSESTDHQGNHKSSKPLLDIIKSNSTYHWTLTDIYGKRIKNYNASNFTNTLDKTGPILIQVKTGQENHTPYNSGTGESSQHSYDAHNFIEFRYSEKVNFGDSSTGGTTSVYDNTNLSSQIWLPAADTNVATLENVRVRDSFGAVTSNMNDSQNLTLAGLGKIEDGKIKTGSNGSDNPYVSSLYRFDEYSIRLSIAGYTEGTSTDKNGNQYKTWLGYIDQAATPTGAVSMVSPTNTLVTDCAVALDGTTPLYNPQTEYAAGHRIEPTVNSSPNGTYGSWDISAPVFAPVRTDPEVWEETDNCEAVGNNPGSGSTLDKIEFHFLDNTPTYLAGEQKTWRTGKGWVQTDGESLYESDTYCADIFGGSRAHATTNRTTGGLRFSTVTQSINAFKYADSQGAGVNPTTPFDSSTNIHIGAKSPLFLSSSGASRSPTDPDGLYFGLTLSQNDLPLTRSFTVSYDDSQGFITDLAGNRLRSAKVKTIDRNPPSFDIILSPMNQKEVYIVFVKQLATNTSQLKYIDDSTGTAKPFGESYESLIPKCFELISIDASGDPVVCTENQVDYGIPASVEHITSSTNGEHFTVVKLTLKNKVTLEEVKNLYLRLIIASGYDATSKDPITAISGSSVTFVQDLLGNYMQLNTAHTLSDFAIGAINPIYAYDDDMQNNGQLIMNGLYEEGSWAVHDWNKEQQNYGTLPANHPFGIVADMDDGTESKSNLPEGVRIYLANNPTASSVSERINSDLNKDYRIWLPETGLSVLPSLAPVNNTNYTQIDSVLLNEKTSASRILFSVSKEVSSSWGTNQQVSFVFGLLDSTGNQIKIYNSLYYNNSTGKYDTSLSNSIPLYSLRLKDPTDITSIDLWSFKTKAITEQRGGVTILNNVINVTKGEKTVLKVNMPSEGNLNVMVMTIDGNIITYLNHGTTSAGEHYYYWDGKNKNNGLVARGLYFIRVVGSDFDETRKVMVVK